MHLLLFIGLWIGLYYIAKKLSWTKIESIGGGFFGTIFLFMIGSYMFSGEAPKNTPAQATAVSSVASTSNDTSKQESKPVKESEPVEAKPIKLSLPKLLDTYHNNEVNADEKYKDKIVRFSGVVDEVKKDFLNNMYVSVGTGKDFEIPVAQCFFEKEHLSQLTRLNKGDRITIIGRVQGLMMNVLDRKSVV